MKRRTAQPCKQGISNTSHASQEQLRLSTFTRVVGVVSTYRDTTMLEDIKDNLQVIMSILEVIMDNLEDIINML